MVGVLGGGEGAVLGVEEVQTLGNAPFFPSSAAAA